MRAAPRSISIADVTEIRFKYRLENARHRLLKQAISDSGYTQRPRTTLPGSLGYIYPPDRWSTVGAGSKPCADFLNSLFQLALKLLDAFPIDPACSAPVDGPPSLLE